MREARPTHSSDHEGSRMIAVKFGEVECEVTGERPLCFEENGNQISLVCEADLGSKINTSLSLMVMAVAVTHTE